MITEVKTKPKKRNTQPGRPGFIADARAWLIKIIEMLIAQEATT